MAYRVECRAVGTATFLRVVANRGGVETPSAEKVLPPVIELDTDGSYKVLSADEILQELKPHPYRVGTGDFTADRIYDLEVSRLYRHLEHFPTQNTEVETGLPHPISEKLYSQMVYIRPTVEFAKLLSTLNFVEAEEKIAQAIQLLDEKFKALKLPLDFYSVPKRKCGSVCFVGQEDGVCEFAKELSFGFYRTIPMDRLMRESSSLRNARRFVQANSGDYQVADYLKPFVQVLRVAVVGYQNPALDSGDLFESGTKKLAVVNYQIEVERDLATLPVEDLQLVPQADRAGIQLTHQVVHQQDEREVHPGGIKLLLPGGVKFVAQPHKEQAFCKKKPVDLMFSTATLASKGALAMLFMPYFSTIPEELTLDYCKENFSSLPLEEVQWNGVTYKGYVFDIPVFRTGQHYGSLSKPASVTEDLIGKAILQKDYTVPRRLEQNYQELLSFRNALVNELKTAQGGNSQ